MDIEKIAQAIEADAGMPFDELRQSLAQIQSGVGRVHAPEQILLRTTRHETGLSQQAFADLINTPVATLRDWEQGRFSPSGAVQCLLKLICKHPEWLKELETH